jgi:hypothetical protein
MRSLAGEEAKHSLCKTLLLTSGKLCVVDARRLVAQGFENAPSWMLNNRRSEAGTARHASRNASQAATETSARWGTQLSKIVDPTCRELAGWVLPIRCRTCRLLATGAGRKSGSLEPACAYPAPGNSPSAIRSAADCLGLR